MAHVNPPAASSENAFAARLFAGLPSRYDLLAEVLSFGQNRRWRQELVRRIASSRPQAILDVATGTGGVAIALARETDARVTGVDLSAEMLEEGRRRVSAAGLDTRIDLRVGRAEELEFAASSFDAVSFTYLLRYVSDPGGTIAQLARVLRPGGVIAYLDFYVPPHPIWRACWWLYTRSLLPAAGLLLGGRSWWNVGRFLGPNIEAHYRRWPLARIVAIWEEAGILDVRCQAMSLGGGLVMWGRKTGA